MRIFVHRIFRPALRWCVGLGLIIGLSGCSKPPDREDLARQGLEAVEFFDFPTGLNKLLPIQADWPEDDPQWLEITYALALSAWHASPPRAEWMELAESLFTLIAEREGDSTVGLTARMNLARMAEISDFPGDEPDYETARRIYTEIIESQDGTDLAMQAGLRLANLKAFTFTEDGARAAIALILDQLERMPDTEWASVAWQYIGDIYINFLNDRSAALAAYEQAYERGFANVARTDLYLWRMGQFAEELDRQAEALHWYRKIVAEHPRSIFGTWAHQYMTRLARTLEEPTELPPPPDPLDVL